MLHNLVLFEKKLASNNKFNALVFGDVDNCKKINVHQDDSS